MEGTRQAVLDVLACFCGNTMREELAQRIIKSYVCNGGLVRHQISSFEHFCEVQLPQIMTETPVLTFETQEGMTHQIEIMDPHVERPSVRDSDGFVHDYQSPHETILRGHTYNGAVLIDAKYTLLDSNGQIQETCCYSSIEVCRVPIMVRSKFCALHHNKDPRVQCTLDSGGYFIINASEKGCISQEKLAINKIFVWKNRTSASHLLTAEVRSCHEDKLRSTSTLCLHLRRTHGCLNIVCSLPFIDGTVGITQLFRILGVQEVDSMLQAVTEKNSKYAVFANQILRFDFDEDETRQSVIDATGSKGIKVSDRAKQRKYMDHIMMCEIFPHIGLECSEETLAAKAIFLGKAIRRLLRVFCNDEPCDDRDHYASKRIDGPGMLCSLLFRQLWRQFLKSLNLTMSKTFDSHKTVNLKDILQARKITSGLNYSFATGSWGVSKGGSAQTGVVQILTRHSHVAAAGSLRRINTPINKDSKTPGVRQLHASSWGIVCPSETPEGQACGLIKNLAVMCHVRMGCNLTQVVDVLSQSTLFDAVTNPKTWSDLVAQNEYAVSSNGVHISYIKESQVKEGEDWLRRQKFSGNLPCTSSVFVQHSEREIVVRTDVGALTRPVVRCETFSQMLDFIHNYRHQRLFDALVSRGFIVFLAKDEEMHTQVSLTHEDSERDGTMYFEIHQSLILGLSASLIPFPEMNQSPRVTYQASMGKQSVGIYASNCKNRLDTVGYVLCGPHAPIVNTWIARASGCDEIPSGQNLIVAIMSQAFNQEDSVIINQDAVDRGLLRCFVQRTTKYDTPCSSQETFSIERPPDQTRNKKYANYAHLQSDGLPQVGCCLQNGDTIIGATVKSSASNEARDHSVTNRHGECFVDMILKSTNKDGKPRVCVRTYSRVRNLNIGDKVSSRHGQKGVVGRVVPGAEMPYCLESGVVPDIIMNPHAVPSRMTIGHLVEALLGITCAADGVLGDGTPFRDVSAQSVRHRLGEILRENGFSQKSEAANWTMVNGLTGQLYRTDIFMGINWYQRLKHMVQDKMHGRVRGPLAIQTRQPLEGRSRDGGLRVGEMEIDCAIAYGAANSIHEFLYRKSDPYAVHVCAVCGLLAEPPCRDKKRAIYRNKVPYCRVCKQSKHIFRINLPYSTKLFIQELMTAHIAPRLRIAQR